jgi:hypothetical protein
MMTRSWIVLLALGLSTAAAAQDDDDLVPLGPAIPKGKPKPKPAAKPKPKPAPVKPKPPVAADDDLTPIAPMAARGELNVKVAGNISGAVLSVDGKELGTLPMGAQSVNAGERTVSVKRPGFAAFVKKVMVPGGKTVDVDAKLTAVAAVLSVQTDITGAQVLLNGRPIGVAPLNDVEIPPGPAELAVVKEGFREESQKINFVAGKDYPVVVKFNSNAVASDRPVDSHLAPTDVGSASPVSGVAMSTAEPITSKWYFWAGIAAGVAAIAVVGTVVGVNTYNTNNALTEPKVCNGGQCDGCISLMCQSGIKPMGSF